MLGAVSDDAVLGAAAALLAVFVTILVAANLRSNHRLEDSVESHAETAKTDVAEVAHAVTEVRRGVAETNNRLHDTRERLARVEGAQQFVIGRQSEAIAKIDRVTTVVETIEGNGNGHTEEP